MPEVSNIGAVDYAQQYPQQYIPEAQTTGDYEAYPAYDGVERQSSSGIGLLTASLISLGVGTAAFFFGKARGAKAGKNAAELAKAQLEELKNSEAVKNYEGLKKAAEDIVAETNKDRSKADPRRWIGWLTKQHWFGRTKSSVESKTIKEKFKPFVDVETKSETAVKEAKDTAKKNDKKD